MPLVRISHRPDGRPELSDQLATGVHDALVATFNVPTDDFFHVVTEHGPDLKITPSFLGIAHGPAPVFVQITCSEGRSADQKKALYAAIVDNLERKAGIRRADVIINLVETKRENWSFGNGLAQYA